MIICLAPQLITGNPVNKSSAAVITFAVIPVCEFECQSMITDLYTECHICTDWVSDSWRCLVMWEQLCLGV